MNSATINNPAGLSKYWAFERHVDTVCTLSKPEKPFGTSWIKSSTHKREVIPITRLNASSKWIQSWCAVMTLLNNQISLFNSVCVNVTLLEFAMLFLFDYSSAYACSLCCCIWPLHLNASWRDPAHLHISSKLLSQTQLAHICFERGVLVYLHGTQTHAVCTAGLLNRICTVSREFECN